MMKQFLVMLRRMALIMVFCAVLVPAFAGQSADTPRDFGKYVQTYHLSPDPLEALERLSALNVAKLLGNAKEKGYARANLVAFYVQVVTAIPSDTFPSAAKRVLDSGEIERQKILADALSFSQRPDRDSMIAEIDFPPGWREQMLTKSPFDYRQKDIKSPPMMDIMWAAFFGSGDKVFLQKIAEVLGPQLTEEDAVEVINKLKPRLDAGDDKAKRQVAKALLSFAAFRSLRANAVASPVVRTHLFNFLDLYNDKKHQDVAIAISLILATTNPAPQ